MRSIKLPFLLLFMVSIGNCAFSQVWKQYTDSAKLLKEQKKVDKAIEFYEAAKEELKKDSAGTISYAAACDDLANVYKETREFGKAEPLLLEVLQINAIVFGKEFPEYAASCHSLAGLYQKMKMFAKAESLYLQAKQIREKVFGKNHLDYAASCSALAGLYHLMGQYERAVPLCLEAKQIFEKIVGKEDAAYAASCGNLANLYRSLGELQKAEPLCLEAKQIREKVLGKDHADYATSCDDLAALYRAMGQYGKAVPVCIEAKEIRAKVLGKENGDYATSCNNLARLYRVMGQFEKAEPLYLEAKQIRERVLGKDRLGYASSCNELAILYKSMGQYGKAELLYLEAKQISEKILGKDHLDVALSCNNLADLYRNTRQFLKAEPLYIKAKQIRENLLGIEHPVYANSCNSLATLYKEMGQFEKAKSLYIEAKQVREKVLGKDHPEYAASCTSLATLYCYMGQFAKAEVLYLEAKQIWRRVLGKEHASYGSSCENLASLYWVLHRPSLAEKEFEESFSSKVYNLGSVFQFTNEKEKAAFIKNILGEDNNAYSFYLSEKIKSGHPYSLSLFHRNLILSASENLRQQVFTANDTALKNKFEEWTNLKKYLSVIYSEPVNERKDDVTKIEDKADQLEKELTRVSSAFARQQQRVDWKDIRNKLQPGEASIEFASFQFKSPYSVGKQQNDTVLYMAFVLRKDSLLPATVFLFNEKQLTALMSSTGNNKLNNGSRKLYTPHAVGINIAGNKSIYDLVWKPLEKELSGIKTIYFAPSGLLHNIAFAALPVNNTEVLSDKYRVIQLASTASIVNQQPTVLSASDKIELYGDINYKVDITSLKNAVFSYHTQKSNSLQLPGDLIRSAGLPDLIDLPGTKKEIEDIAILSGEFKPNITCHTRINATEESLKALDGPASPAILHIATHGFFFPDPKHDEKHAVKRIDETAKVFRASDDPLMRSGLLFAGANWAWQNKPVKEIDDGILTAYEVSNLYLANTKLVVLSACETGLGDIQGSEGVYGLQRSFKIAGVNNLVMSLWKVLDVQTAEFMEQFYKGLFEKQSVGNAFYMAQEAMKNKYRKEPYKWAAWVLVR